MSYKDPIEDLDYRTDSGPPEKKPFVLSITITFQAVKYLIKKIFRRKR